MTRIFTDQMELRNQDFEIKQCFVQIEKLMADDDSDDSSDLPAPKYLSPSKPKHKRTAAELILEHQNLQINIERDILADYNMEERFQAVQIVYEEFKEEESPIEEDPSSIMCERKEDIFCVLDSLQFFNSRDVTPLMCGYKFSIGISHFEDKMLSFKRVELENVISSFLLTSTSNGISDCKSFISYLLRSMSVQEDPASIFACFNALNSLLAENPDVKLINFNSAEIFMLFFNYGIDMNTFTFLQQWPDVQQSFTVPEFNAKSYSKIPSIWTLNLEMILKSFSKLASTCHILDKDLTQIITFLLWMNLSNLLHIFPLIQENISICLKCITKKKWDEALCVIANIVIGMDFPNNKGKWHNILLITKGIPVYSKRGIQLQRLISSWVLKLMFSKTSVPELDKKYIEFDLSVVQNLLQEFFNLPTETLSFAIKFIDIYITHLNATKEVYQELYNVIVRSEVALHHESSEAKSNLCIMTTKLRKFIGKNPVYKVSMLENVFKKIKKEVEEVSTENEVVQTPFIQSEIKMEVEEAVCSENSALIASKTLDSDINSGEQNVYSTDKFEDFQAATIFCAEDTNLKSADLNYDVKPGDILNLNSNFNVIEKDFNSNASNSEVPKKEMEVVSKSYFIDSSVVVEDNVNCNIKSLNVDNVSTDDNANQDFSRQDSIYGKENSTVQGLLSKETCELQGNEIFTEIDSNIVSETNFTKLEDGGIEIFEVHCNVTSFQDSISEENDQSMTPHSPHFLENTDFNCAKDYPLTSNANIFPSVNESISSQCETLLDDVLVYIDVAEEVCIDSNSNHTLTFIKQETDIWESEQQPLINEESTFISSNSGKKQEIDKNQTDIEIQIPKIKDSIVNTIKYVDEVEHSYANADKFTKNDPTCKDLITAVEGDTERDTENLKRKLQTSFIYKPLNKKLKTENQLVNDSSSEFDNKVIDSEISNVLEGVIDMTVNSSLENLPNECQPISEVLTNNEGCSNSLSNIIEACDLEILDEKGINEDLTVIHIKHSKTKLKNSKALMGSSVYNKSKGLNRARKNKDEDKRDNKKDHNSSQKHKKKPSLSERDIPGRTGYAGTGFQHKAIKIKKSSPLLKFDPKKVKKPFYSSVQTKQKYEKYRKGKSAISTSGLNLIRTEYSELNINLTATSSQAQEICLSDDSDSSSDIIELYTDPKRYADKDCLIIFESEDQIVLSD